LTRKNLYERDIKGGVWIGVQYAAFYTVIALAIQTLAGTLTTTRGWITLGRYALVYVLAGIAGGALYGLLKPITDRKWGLMLVLSFAGIIFYTFAMYTFLDLNDKPSEPGLWVLTVVIGIAFGIAVGDKLWKKRARQ
jgi:peptidoglycan/LPS O-acetylase OafA/YrhL